MSVFLHLGKQYLSEYISCFQAEHPQTLLPIAEGVFCQIAAEARLSSSIIVSKMKHGLPDLTKLL